MESDKNNSMKMIHKVSIAPMLDVTNNHFRTMMRLITREAVMYTEMIHHDTILHSKFGYENELYFNIDQNPTVIQLGGNNPDLLEKVAILCKNSNYEEINLNCGCPSTKVQNSNFGACLMRDPLLVSECTRRMREASNLNVTVKCRLGLDTFDQTYLNNFIDTVSSVGKVDHFIIHARLAIMKFDTKENRRIPPLQYNTVIGLQSTFPKLNFTLNGGIKNLDDVEELLKFHHGCMIGRTAYENPWILSDVDRRFYNKTNPNFSRKEIVYKYAEYCDLNFKEQPSLNDFIKPLTYLFSGERMNSEFKKMLYQYNNKSEMCLGDHFKFVIEEYEKMNYDAVNKLPNEN